MVARTPPKHQKKLMVAPLNPTLIRETVKKVDQCMARLQELQYTVAGGNKVVAGVNLSPRSTRGYLKASLRCKQESIRIKGAKRSPTGKLPSNAAGDWRRMSLPAMLLGETVQEILKASQFATDITETISDHKSHPCAVDDPKTPVTIRRKQRPSDSDTGAAGIESRRKREKQHKLRIIRLESDTPAPRRARSRINFKVPSPNRAELVQLEKESRQLNKSDCNSIRYSANRVSRINFKVPSPNRAEMVQLEKESRQLNKSDPNSARYSANRVSPRHKPWAKKTVLFPNPLFNSSPNSQRQRFGKTKSPIIAKKKAATQQIGANTTTPTKTTTPHKFIIKSPPSAKSKFQVKIRSPVAVAKISHPRAAAAPGGYRRAASPLRMVVTATAAKLRRSLSPARLASRLMSPLKKSRSNSVVQGSGGGGGVVSGFKHRPGVVAMGFRAPRF